MRWFRRVVRSGHRHALMFAAVVMTVAAAAGGLVRFEPVPPACEEGGLAYTDDEDGCTQDVLPGVILEDWAEDWDDPPPVPPPLPEQRFPPYGGPSRETVVWLEPVGPEADEIARAQSTRFFQSLMTDAVPEDWPPDQPAEDHPDGFPLWVVLAAGAFISPVVHAIRVARSRERVVASPQEFAENF